MSNPQTSNSWNQTIGSWCTFWYTSPSKSNNWFKQICSFQSNNNSRCCNLPYSRKKKNHKSLLFFYSKIIKIYVLYTQEELKNLGFKVFNLNQISTTWCQPITRIKYKRVPILSNKSCLVCSLSFFVIYFVFIDCNF